MKNIVLASIVSVSLAACGAGSTDNVQVPDYSSAINQALKNYAATMPKITPSPGINPTLPVAPVSAPTPYTGALVTAEGVDAGFIAGTDDINVITQIANVIISDPAKYQPLYAILLSDAGMHFTLKRNTWDLPVSYVARLTNGGLVVSRV